MNILRRRILTALAAVVPVLAVDSKMSRVLAAPAAANLPAAPATGAWAILEHVTDGTDPSTALVAPPNFTADIRKLEGTQVTLTGYLQSVAGGFGKKDYLLSRASFHCPYCYAAGRGSLVLASIEGHTPASGKPVTVTGTLALQGADPTDFYFQLKNAKVV